MRPVLHVSRNPNPRLAAAVARQVGAAVEIVFAAPFAPGQAERFLALNPTQRIPILEEPGRAPLWEADAIACRLSQLAGSEFWRSGEALPDMIRWLSWGRGTFVAACDAVHFERGTKQRYRQGPVDEARLAEGLGEFARAAPILDRHLAGRDWVCDGGPSYADFRLATFLPFNAAARLPLEAHPTISAWHDRLCTLPAWADPFEGLEIPDLPPLPSA